MFRSVAWSTGRPDNIACRCSRPTASLATLGRAFAAERQYRRSCSGQKSRARSHVARRLRRAMRRCYLEVSHAAGSGHQSGGLAMGACACGALTRRGRHRTRQGRLRRRGLGGRPPSPFARAARETRISTLQAAAGGVLFFPRLLWKRSRSGSFGRCRRRSWRASPPTLALRCARRWRARCLCANLRVVKIRPPQKSFVTFRGPPMKRPGRWRIAFVTTWGSRSMNSPAWEALSQPSNIGERLLRRVGSSYSKGLSNRTE